MISIPDFGALAWGLRGYGDEDPFQEPRDLTEDRAPALNHTPAKNAGAPVPNGSCHDEARCRRWRLRAPQANHAHARPPCEERAGERMRDRDSGRGL